MNNSDHNPFSENSIRLAQEMQYSQVDPAASDLDDNEMALSARQKDCLHFFARGMPIKQIGKILKLSPKTVESYLGLIKAKLKCTTRYDLIKKAIELGLF